MQNPRNRLDALQMPGIKLYIAAGTSRSALIRDRALTSGLPRLGTVAYNAQVEALTAYVITRLDKHHA